MLKLLVYLVLLMMIKQNAAQTTAKVYTKGSNAGATLPTTASAFNALCTGGTFPGVIGSQADADLLKSATYNALCGAVSGAYTGCALAITPAATLGTWIVDMTPASTYLQGKTILYTGGTKAATGAAANIGATKCLVVGADTSDIYITGVTDPTSVPLLCQNYDESSTTTSTTTTTTTTTKSNGAIETSLLACWIMFCVGRFYWIMA